MDYVEKRKNGKKRIFEKKRKENEKKERIETSRSYSVAIRNDVVSNAKYKDLSLYEQKIYRYVLSLIKKGDDINTTFIVRHKGIRELFNHNFTSKDVFEMLKKISSSFALISKNKNGKYEFLHLPIFKSIRTSENFDTTEVIFNEFFNSLIFNLQKGGHFLKYELSSILDYKCLHSIKLFELLLSIVRANKKDEIVSIDYDIEELKVLFNCESQRTNDFINRVIKKSIEEINLYNKKVLGGTIDYKYNKTKKKITFYVENIVYMLKLEKKK